MSSSDTSKAIARCLESGWALLAHTCPNCTTPLVQDKEKRMFCVKCQARVVRESEIGSDGNPKDSSSSKPVSLPSPVTPAVSLLRSSASSSASASTTTSSGLRPAMPSAPAAIASAAPVADSTATANNTSASSHNNSNGNGKVEHDSPQHSGVGSGSGSHVATDDEWLMDDDEPYVPRVLTEEEKARQRRRDQVSSLMGQKLLLGWKMLDALCPADGCPLMQPKDGPMQCVACNSVVVPEQKSASPAALAPLSPHEPPANFAVPAPGSLPSDHKTDEDERVRQLLADRQQERALEKAALTRAAPLDLEHEPAASMVSAYDANTDPRNVVAPETDPSMLLSDKLLQGWAMLERCCQFHSEKWECPLMRDFQGVAHCVVCHAKYGKNGELLSSSSSASASSSSSSSASASSAAPSSALESVAEVKVKSHPSSSSSSSARSAAPVRHANTRPAVSRAAPVVSSETKISETDTNTKNKSDNKTKKKKKNNNKSKTAKNGGDTSRRSSQSTAVAPPAPTAIAKALVTAETVLLDQLNATVDALRLVNPANPNTSGHLAALALAVGHLTDSLLKVQQARN